MPTKKNKVVKPARRAAQSTHKKTSKSKTKKQVRSNKLLYGAILAVAIVVFAGLAIVAKKNQSATLSPNGLMAKMSLESDKQAFKTGDVVTVKVYADSSTTSVNAVQAVVTYPSQVLGLKDISTTGTAYPVQAYQSTEGGRVEIVRGVVRGVTSKQLVSELRFVAKTSGDARLSFDQPATILVDSARNKNILSGTSFNDINIEVQ